MARDNKVKISLELSGLSAALSGIKAAASGVEQAQKQIGANSEALKKAIPVEAIRAGMQEVRKQAETAAEWYARTAVAGAKISTLETQRAERLASLAKAEEEAAAASESGAQSRERWTGHVLTGTAALEAALKGEQASAAVEKQITAEKVKQTVEDQKQASVATRKLTTTPAVNTGLRNTSRIVGGMSSILTSMPSIAVALGASRFGGIISELITMASLVRGISMATEGAARAGQGTAGAIGGGGGAGSGGAVAAGAAGGAGARLLAAGPAIGAAGILAATGVGLWVRRLLNDPAEARTANMEAANIGQLERLISSTVAAREAGNLRGEEAAALNATLNQLLSQARAGAASKDDQEREDVAFNIGQKLPGLIRRFQSLEQASYEAEAGAQQAAAESRLAVRGEALATEQRLLEEALGRELRSTTSSYSAQMNALRRFVSQSNALSDERTRLETDSIRLRIKATEEEMARKSNDVEEVTRLTAQLTRLEADLTRAVMEGSERRRQARAVESEGGRQITLRRLGSWRNTRQNQIRGLRAAGAAGTIDPGDVPDGPNPDSFGEQGLAATNSALSQIGTTAEQAGRTLLSSIGGAISSISQGIEGLLTGTMAWKDALGSIATGVIRSVIQGISQMFAEWIIKMTLLRGLEKVFSGQRKAEVATELPLNTANAAAASGGSFGVSAFLGLAAFVALMAAAAAFSGGFAKGGRPPKGKVALVGEQGPELFIPDMGGTVIPADRTANLLGSIGASGAGGLANDQTIRTLASGAPGKGASGANLKVLIVDDVRGKAARDFITSEEGQLEIIRLSRRNATSMGIPT